jgi:hypothetical protein
VIRISCSTVYNKLKGKILRECIRFCCFFTFQCVWNNKDFRGCYHSLIDLKTFFCVLSSSKPGIKKHWIGKWKKKYKSRAKMNVEIKQIFISTQNYRMNKKWKLFLYIYWIAEQCKVLVMLLCCNGRRWEKLYFFTLSLCYVVQTNSTMEEMKKKVYLKLFLLS